ncbi:MAG: hypothetical protein ACO3U0_11195, partial [Ilumatobacteraceae bacterium]
MTASGTHSLTRSRWAAIGAAIAITLGGGGLIGVSASGTESTFVPVEPGRILDTRNSTPVGADNAYGTPLRLKVAGADLVDGSRSAGIPSTATAVAATITATSTGGWGFVTAYPCDSTNDTPPGASNVNYTAADQTVANSAIVPLSTDGYICLTAYDTTHLLLDVSGYYTATSAGVAGPAGPQGPQGDTGPQGPQGERGPANRITDEQIALLAWYEDPGAPATITVGTGPFRIAYDGTNIYVTNYNDGTVS